MEQTNFLPNPRYANSGSFQKGHTAWNKGKKGTGRKYGYERGRRGFISRPVLAIAPDGSVKYRYASVSEAAKALRLSRHSITYACKKSSLCRGMKLLYDDEYVAWADYSYPARRIRDDYGRYLPGHHNGAYKKSAEARQRLSVQARKMILDPNNRFGKGNYPKPVTCITTGEQFPSVKAAAEHFGFPSTQISRVLNHFPARCHGLQFRFTPKTDDNETD